MHKGFAIVAILLALSFSPALAEEKPSTAAAPFSVKVVGKGTPMILIPGLACSGAVWDETVDHFKASYECHVLTLAGFAGQPALKERGPYLETVRKGIARYIKDKNLDKPVIVGHSLGGVLVYALGSAEPDLVGPLIVVDAMPCLPAVFDPEINAEGLKKQGEAAEKQLASLSHDEFLKHEKQFFGNWISEKDRLDKIGQWVADSDQATIARALGELFASDFRRASEMIKTPVLLLAAYDKSYEKSGLSREVFEKKCFFQLSSIKHIEINVTTKAKHFIMFDQPKWMWERMDEFLKTQEK